MKICVEVAVADTPLDVLYGTCTPEAYWWPCFFLLWLKTVINVLYTYGRANQVGWQIWMYMILAVSMILMFYFDPYVAPVDQHVALVSLLSLAGVAHISSIFKAGTTWDPLYIILTALLFLLPLVAYGVEHGYHHFRRGDKGKAQTIALEALEATAMTEKVMLRMLPRAFKKFDADSSGAFIASIPSDYAHSTDLVVYYTLARRCQSGCAQGFWTARRCANCSSSARPPPP